jgi:uncharacterized protein (TIGR03435 family)
MWVVAGIGLVLSSLAFGQSFDISDVRVSAAATNPDTFASGGLLRGGRYDLRRATMLDLIRVAWGVDPDRVVGGPSWLELDRFDISAKAPASGAPEAVGPMLQALLADRFGLAVHNDTRPLPAYALRMGKEKPKLRESDSSGAQAGASPSRSPRGRRSRWFPAAA